MAFEHCDQTTKICIGVCVLGQVLMLCLHYLLLYTPRHDIEEILRFIHQHFYNSPVIIIDNLSCASWKHTRCSFSKPMFSMWAGSNLLNSSILLNLKGIFYVFSSPPLHSSILWSHFLTVISISWKKASFHCKYSDRKSSILLPISLQVTGYQQKLNSQVNL